MVAPDSVALHAKRGPRKLLSRVRRTLLISAGDIARAPGRPFVVHSLKWEAVFHL